MDNYQSYFVDSNNTQKHLKQYETVNETEVNETEVNK